MTLLRVSWRMCFLQILFAAFGAVHAAQPTSQQMQLSGVWRVEKPVFEARTTAGNTPPLRAEAAKIYQERIAARKHGDTSFDSATWCASVGMPRLMFIDAPFQIIVRPSHVVFLYEWNGWVRTADMAGVLAPLVLQPPGPIPGTGPAPDAGPTPGAGPPPGVGPPSGPPPPSSPPNAGPTAPSEQTSGDGGVSVSLPGPMGAVVGRWEGNTLVMETTDLIDTTLIDGAGMPRSDALKLTERLRLLSADRLEDLIRVEDPTTFTEPWETRVTYRRQRDATVKEDVCLDRIKHGEAAVKE